MVALLLRATPRLLESFDLQALPFVIRRNGQNSSSFCSKKVRVEQGWKNGVGFAFSLANQCANAWLAILKIHEVPQRPSSMLWPLFFLDSPSNQWRLLKQPSLKLCKKVFPSTEKVKEGRVSQPEMAAEVFLKRLNEFNCCSLLSVSSIVNLSNNVHALSH